MKATPLPIDAHLDRIVEAVRRHRAAIVSAAPGAGKTTRVPPALTADGPVLLLQPRRVAARAIARRIADEQAWTIGREVGWHVRFDRRSSADTRLLVATEGMLTVRLQQDPLLSDFRTVILDEFHERSIHSDLGLALARQAWVARTDLRVVLMSATMDAAAAARFLGDCPIVEVPGREFPLEIEDRPDVGLDRAILDLVTGPPASFVRRGAVLCFLPGAAEIRRTGEAVGARAAAAGVAVLPLHGGLEGEEQDAALQPSSQRRVILATNIAETSLTVPDVTCVIDTGMQKVARYDSARGIDSLELERVTQDSADQRAGRAGRTQAGTVIRLWDSRDRLRPHREPDIARVDLAGPALDVLAWGGDPRTLEWFEPPPAAALASALVLLERLGAVDAAGRLTDLGQQMHRLPLSPRLARLLLATRGGVQAAWACALLSERHLVPARRQATSCDLLSAIEDEPRLPGHVRHTAQQIGRVARGLLGDAAVDRVDEATFRRGVLAAYPDRVARRREPRTDRLLLSTGTGAKLGRESGVIDAEFLVAVDVTSSVAGADALVRLATAIEPDWLAPTSRTVEHWLDEASGAVRAAEVRRYGQIVLSEHPRAPDPAQSAPLVAGAYLRRGPTDADLQLLRRLAFVDEAVTFDALVAAAAAGRTRVDDIDLASSLPHATRQALERGAPERFTLPSRRTVAIEYRETGPFVAVKLQELFGVQETPTIGRRRVPLTFELLAPNGRPVQVTSDLRSFWARGYPEVRKELRGRYPRHKWPEEPHGK